MSTAVAALTVACSSDGEPDGSDTPAADLEGEAPMLAKLVEAGDLPPVQDRLPAVPLVVEPVDQVGQYGGIWQTAMNGPGDSTWLALTMGYEALVRWVPNWTGAPGYDEIIPNLAESFEVSDDGTEFTFKLREGLKWSDGELLTMDDFVFGYEEVVLNSDIYPTPHAWAVSGGEPATLRVDDDHTFTLVFAEPAGAFLSTIAEGWQIAAPKHYLTEFHADHNDDIDELVSSEGFGNWVELFNAKEDFEANADRPVVLPWVLTQAIGDSAHVTAERNPYYWKVDAEGNQLPYLDGIRYQVIDDLQVILAAALQGDLDMHSRHVMTPEFKPTLAQSREDGDYEFFEMVPTLANAMEVMFNLTHKDEVMKEIFNNKDFRIGLSHAINREELIDAVHQRQGDPYQVAPRPESPFYNEQLATQYTEHDVNLANQHLDAAGYEMDASGARLGPDGEPISFIVDHAGQAGMSDALELISDYWAEVGIEMRPNPVDRAFFEEHRRANEHDAVVWAAGGGTDVIVNPHWYLPVSDRADYAQLWAEWYMSGGTSGEEPPEGTLRQQELYAELGQAVEAEDQERLMNEILEIAAEQFYHVGTVLPGPGYGIVKNNFHNVPDSMPDSFRIKTPALTNPEQYFKTE